MRVSLIGTAIVLLLGLGCGGGQSTGSIPFERGPMPEGGNWAGIWFTNWGQMSISRQGSAVVGEFCDDDSNRFGRIEGTAQGDLLAFHWVTTDTTMIGRPRRTEGSAAAQFRFEQSGDIQVPRFEGTWGFGTANSDGGRLRGDRSETYSNRFLRSNYSIPCEIRGETESPAALSDEDVGDNPDYSEPEEDMGGGIEEAPSSDEGPLDL